MVAFSSSSLASSIRRLLSCMGGCFGCRSKSMPIVAVDEPAKGLRIKGRTLKRPSSFDDLWSSSIRDSEKVALQSQGSISSVSTSTLNHSMRSMRSDPDFVNHGLILWGETRLQWTGSGKVDNQTRPKPEDRLRRSTAYESVLGSPIPFAQPVPLSEMVEFLVKSWEQEGLYD